MRVVRRVAELRGDARLEVLGDDVLERLGLLVHAVPRHAEVLGEVELEQPVVAQDLERDALALGGQRARRGTGTWSTSPSSASFLTMLDADAGVTPQPRGEVVRRHRLAVGRAAAARRSPSRSPRRRC